MTNKQAPSYHDLAGWYDAIYDASGKDYAAEGQALLSLAQAGGAEPRSLLDVACGTGRHLEFFAQHLDEVVGTDTSSEMLTIASVRLGPSVTVDEADFRTLDLGRSFDIVTCLFSSIGHVTNEAELDQAVAAMAAHVAPRGTLVIEPWLTPDRVTEGGVRDLATANTPDGVVARASSSVPDGDALVVSFAWAVATPGGVASLEEERRMPLFSADRYIQAVEATGLAPEWLDDVPALTAGRGLLVGRRSA